VADTINTFSVVWLERSLDDSTNRHITIPEAFLNTDACLLLLIDITSILIVYPAVINKRIQEELLFMAM
jgi:adenylosuccinate lyase